MTRVKLGKLLGVSATEIYHYERGLRRIPPERVDLVTRITGIPRHKLRPDIFLPLKIDTAING